MLQLLSNVILSLLITAFCATRSISLSTSANVIDFDAETFVSETEEGSGFDLATDTFTPPATGIYWLQFSVGYLDTASANITLVGLPTGRMPNIPRMAPGVGSLDTTSRCELAHLTAGVDKLHLSTTGPLWSEPDGVEVSWSGFHLDSTMATVAAFAVGRSTSLTSLGQIAFDMVHVDTHSGWRSNHYVIPVGGTWVITLHCGDRPDSTIGNSALFSAPTVCVLQYTIVLLSIVLT